MEFIKKIRFISLSVILVLISSSILFADPIEVDTTKVREVKKIKKSVGEIITEIPGEILKLPLNVFEFTVYTIGTNPPIENILSLVKLGQEPKYYIPVMGYGPKSGLKFGFGFRKINNVAKDDKLKFKWYYSTNAYQSYKVEYRKESFFTKHLGLDLYFRYKKRPRESFYGLGINSREDKEASYTLENTEFKVEIPFQTLTKMYLSLIGGYQITNLYDGRDPSLEGSLNSIFADSNYALKDGHLDASRYHTIGASFEFDGRNSSGQPSKGTHLYAKFIKYIGNGVSDGQDLTEYNIDLRQYYDIWNKRIVAIRMYLQRFDADDDNNKVTPIYLISKLGGKEALRGYSSGRYIDNDLAFVSIEYRYPIYDFIDAFIFLDEGRVYKKMTDEKFLEEWKYSAGFGFRVWNTDDIIAIIQFAKSDEANKIYFELGATW